MIASSGFSESELLQMQQDALRRVKQMQDRARANLQAQQSEWSSPTGPPEPSSRQAQPHQQNQPRVPVPPPQNRPGGQRNPPQGGGGLSAPASGGLGGALGSLLSGGSSPLSGLLGAIGGDRILILLLMVLLLGEEGDQTLILALCYLLLFD